MSIESTTFYMQDQFGTPSCHNPDYKEMISRLSSENSLVIRMFEMKGNTTNFEKEKSLK